MKLRKRSRDFELHRRRYIKLSITLFVLSFILNAWHFSAGWDTTIGGLPVLPITGIFAMFISGAMAFMGLFYLKK